MVGFFSKPPVTGESSSNVSTFPKAPSLHELLAKFKEASETVANNDEEKHIREFLAQPHLMLFSSAGTEERSSTTHVPVPRFTVVK